MNIATIECHLVHEWLIVEVITEGGLRGIGQTGYWAYPDACIPVIDSYRDLLVGRSALARNELWLRMFRSLPFRGANVVSAIAAIDIALWDLAGKHYGVPTYELLGGPVRDKARLHAVLATGWLEDGSDPTALIDEAKAAVAEGFTAIKFDPLVDGPEGFTHQTHARMLKQATEIVAAVRETVGWDIDIAIEAHRKLGVAEAVELGEMLAGLGVFMYEDALPPDSLAAWAQLCAKTRIPIGTGERNDTIYEFRELLDGGVAFVRPDVGMAGGISHTVKIAALAEAHHAQLLCHNYVSPLITAATLQVYAAVTNVATLEYTLLDEQAPRTQLLKEPLRRDGGYLRLPTGPGLGVELADDFADRLGPYVPWRPHLINTRPEGSIHAR